MPQNFSDVPVGINAKHVATNSTVTVKSGAGYLEGITVNAAGTGTVKLYDNTAASGTLIATITVESTFVAPGGVTYGLNFLTGLTVVAASGAPDVTVLYR